MTPLRTVHAGEFLVGTHLERTFRGCRVWMPSRDSGIDLLVTDNECLRTVSLQVKFSRSFEWDNLAFPGVIVSSFFTVQRRKLEASPAQYWVFVLHPFNSKHPHFLVIRRKELLEEHIKKYPAHQDAQRLYFTLVGESESNCQCWDLRCSVAEQKNALRSKTIAPYLDYSAFLDDWSKMHQELLSGDGR